jgi:hypothetical protein
MPTTTTMPAIAAPLLSPRFKQRLTYGAAALTFVIGGVGLLHTSVGRPVLAKLGIACPLTKATPQQIDHARTIPAAAFAGMSNAPARPALGFAFEKTTMDEIEAWAKANHIDCAPINGNETLRACKNVKASTLGEPPDFAPAEEVAFEFRASHTLAVVSVLRRNLSVEQANAMTAAASNRLRAALGAPQRVVGENTAAHFAKGPLQAYQEEYQFGDYAATLTETRLGTTGVLFREQFFSPVP